jgi:hypothetical protein
MTPVENYIYEQEGEEREIMLHLHHMLVNLNLTPKFVFKLPFYYGKTWICYLRPLKKGGVEFTFPRGGELSNTQGLLQSKGRKLVMGIEFHHLKDIPEIEINEIIQEAILLDKNVTYRFPRKD